MESWLCCVIWGSLHSWWMLANLRSEPSRLSSESLLSPVSWINQGAPIQRCEPQQGIILVIWTKTIYTVREQAIKFYVCYDSIFLLKASVFELGKRLKSVHPEMLTVTFFGRWDDGYVSLLLSSCLAHSFGSQTAGQNHTPPTPLQPGIPLRSQPGLSLPSKPHGSLPIHLPLSTLTTSQH